MHATVSGVCSEERHTLQPLPKPSRERRNTGLGSASGVGDPLINIYGQSMPLSSTPTPRVTGPPRAI